MLSPLQMTLFQRLEDVYTMPWGRRDVLQILKRHNVSTEFAWKFPVKEFFFSQFAAFNFTKIWNPSAIISSRMLPFFKKSYFSKKLFLVASNFLEKLWFFRGLLMGTLI